MSTILNPEFDNGAMHKYIFIIDQRYGGTWLTTLLREQVGKNRDAIVHIEGELYKKPDVKPNLCNRIMAEFFNSPKCAGRMICAFRMPYFVWPACDFPKLAIREQIGVIHIVRDNKIDWLMSHGVATELRNQMKTMNLSAAQVMHCKEGEKCYAEEVNKIRLVPLHAIQSMREQQALDRNISEALTKGNLRYRSFLYEDIVLMGTSIILDFMGINVTETNQGATTRFKKRITRPQQEVINNYPNFVRFVKNTEFRWYLDYCIQNVGKVDHC
jgi:hypothetical protein